MSYYDYVGLISLFVFICLGVWKAIEINNMVANKFAKWLIQKIKEM